MMWTWKNPPNYPQQAINGASGQIQLRDMGFGVRYLAVNIS